MRFSHCKLRGITESRTRNLQSDPGCLDTSSGSLTTDLGQKGGVGRMSQMQIQTAAVSSNRDKDGGGAPADPGGRPLAPSRFVQNHAVFSQFSGKTPFFEQMFGSGPSWPKSCIHRWAQGSGERNCLSGLGGGGKG